MENQSRQPRFSAGHEAALNWLRLFEKWSKQALITVPAYTADSRELDTWLRAFWKQEPLLSGVISSVVSIDKNRGWSLTGGRNQVNRFSSVLRNPNPVIVEGQIASTSTYRFFASQQSESFWTTNLGAVTEKGSDIAGGRLSSLWHVDSARCALTGNTLEPLRYYPAVGKEQVWPAGSFFITNAMPSPDETYRGLGYCATMRAIQLGVIMSAIYRHDQEMLYSAMQKGILLMRGIDNEGWNEAMEVHNEVLTQREREYFAGVSILFGDESLSADMVNLSQLPENFSLSEFTNILMYGYALCFGYDPREFWPVSGGTLGTGQETEVQSIKATAKGGLDFALSYQDNLQKELPPSVLFEFEQRNEAGQQLEAQVMEAYASAINTMSLSPIPGGETLTREERRYLYAQRGLIPDEWTIPEEDVTATDTDTDAERQRLLSLPQVRRACAVFKDEPIVRYSWPLGIVRELWPSGEQALHRRSYPVKKRQEALYSNEELDFTVTNADVARAIAKWNALQDQKFTGMLQAEKAEA